MLSTKSESLRQEEIEVENHFLNTVSLNEQGRFVVQQPFHQSIEDLCDSHYMLVLKLFNIEKRLAKD